MPASAQTIGQSATAESGSNDGNRFKRWHTYGNFGVRGEYYENRGDPGLALYFSEGSKNYSELELHADRRFSENDHLRSKVFILDNHSDYRSNIPDFQIEQLNITWEKGDASIPFRFEAGNFFSYLSYRTIQRSLKGIQVELQPKSRLGNRRHSMILFAGTPAPSYRGLRPQENLFSGASWLTTNSSGTSFGLNLVNHDVDGNRSVDGTPRSQQVVSAAGYAEAEFLDQQIGLESELGFMFGDATARGRTFKDKSDSGILVSFSGQSNGLPLFYSARYERYGTFYDPAAAVITPNRRSQELRAAWLLNAGPQISFRQQWFRRPLEGNNPRDTRTTGVSIAGPIQKGGRNFILLDGDAFVQSTDDQQGTVNTETTSINLDLGIPIGSGWTARTGLFGQHIEDRIDPGGNSQTRQVRLGLQKDFQLSGDWGYISPDVYLRRVRGSSRRDEVLPGLSFGLYGDNYTLDAWYYGVRQDQLGTDSVDFVSDGFGMLATLNSKQHYWQFEANYDRLELTPGGDGRSWRVGLEYTYFFNKRSGKEKSMPALSSPTPTPSPISDFSPGLLISNAIERLKQQGIVGGIPSGNRILFSTRSLLPEIQRNQRLIIVHNDVSVVKSAIIIDFDRAGGMSTRQQDYELIRGALLKRLGNPSQNFERGSFGPNLVARIASRDFVRITDWETTDGIVRLGIPRSFDGDVHMEIQFRRANFPSPPEPAWGIRNPR